MLSVSTPDVNDASAYHRLRDTLAARGPIRETATGFTCRCPAHDDRHASLSVSDGDGKTLLHCFAGCRTEDILRPLGLKPADLFDTHTRPVAAPRPRVVGRRTYVLRELDGTTVAEHVRVDKADGSKDVFWRRDGENGLQGMPLADLPLYRLPDLTGASIDAPVVVTEGEKAADALAERGILALGTVTGAGGTPSAARLEVLIGHDVVLWPDNDDVGRDHMARIAATLATLGITARIIDWPEAPSHGDAADFTGTAAEFQDLIASAEPAEHCSRQSMSEPLTAIKGSNVDGDVAALRRQIAELEAELSAERAAHAETRAECEAIRAALGNKGLHGAAPVAVAVLQAARMAEKAGDVDADGWFPAPQATIGRMSASCAKTVKRHEERLQAIGQIEVTQREAPWNGPGESTTYLRILKGERELLDTLATVELPKDTELEKYRRKMTVPACCDSPRLVRKVHTVCLNCKHEPVEADTLEGAPNVRMVTADGEFIDFPSRPARNIVPILATSQFCEVEHESEPVIQVFRLENLNPRNIVPTLAGDANASPEPESEPVEILPTNVRESAFFPEDESGDLEPTGTMFRPALLTPIAISEDDFAPLFPAQVAQ